MLPKPEPKIELVVKLVDDSMNVIQITANSNDAREFVLKNAHEFGDLVPFSDGAYNFFVREGYDAQEVLQYFLSYND